MADGTVVILGGRGMLGTDLAESLTRDAADVRVFDLPEFDITDRDQLRQAVSGADAVINCAAYTNVDGAESHAELAHAVNAEAVGRLGALLAQSDTWLLHFGTDFVFDGTLDRPYLETDTPNPISQYGKSKLAGEQLLAETGCRHCVIRVQWTYGRAGNNFVRKLVSRAETDGVLRVVDDQVGAPTATTEVAEAVRSLLPAKPLGLYHYAAAGYVTRYKMARFVAEKLSLDARVLPCSTSDFNSPAARPLNSRFNCRRIAALLEKPIRPWRQPLEEFLRQL